MATKIRGNEQLVAGSVTPIELSAPINALLSSLPRIIVEDRIDDNDILSVPVTNAALLNAVNVFSLINPLTTLAESWIGPSSTAGIYFKGGLVGIGTITPGQKLHILGSFRSEDTASGGASALLEAKNDVGAVCQFTTFGSATGGSIFGLTTNNLAAFLADTYSTAPSAFVIGIVQNKSLVLGQNNTARITITAASSAFAHPINLKNYTVGTLPVGTRGDIAYVTDALAPTFLAIVVGGGAVVAPVFYNGANWIGF